MNLRERNMIIGLLAVIVLGGGAAAGYALVISPLQDVYEARAKLEEEIDGTPDKQGLDANVDAMRKAVPVVKAAKRASLPPNLDLAKNQYTLLLERLLQKARIPYSSYKIPEPMRLDSKSPVTPELSAKKPAYTRMAFKVEMENVDIWQVGDFLEEFYKLALLHQITELDIRRQNKVTETRRGLTVHVTVEAITLDGAEPRTALFPVLSGGEKAAMTLAGEAIAAVGGGLLVAGVAASPEVAQRATAQTTASVLSSKGRNYSWLPLNDVFYGVLIPPKTPPGLTIEKISELTVKPGQKLPEVKVVVTGDGADGAVVTAAVENTGTATPMLADGPLEVDPRTRAIRFPIPREASGRTYSYVKVTATADGRSRYSSFRVSYAGDDISSAIRLVMVSESDGVGTAQVLDIASPHKYNITAAPKKEIEVIKYRPAGRTMKEWEKDPRYKAPVGVLALSDDSSSTRRFFRVVAVDVEDASIIVQELDKPDAKPDAKGGTPTLFRWQAGKSLKDLDRYKVKPDDAKRILARGAAAPAKVED